LRDLYASAGYDICEELEKAQTMRPIVHIGGYGSEIHEQSELALNNWGQYAHSNQPVHHMLYMFGASDPKGVTGQCAAKGQHYIRKVLDEMYRPDWKMFTGDEDNGQMSAWYILSSLGLYSLSPSSGEYVFGSPQFQKVVVHIDDSPRSVYTSAVNNGAKTLTIEAIDNSPSNVYVHEVRWNDVAVEAGVNSIKYATLMEGGTLTFVMGDKPLSSTM
jgi:putative alpha-1,2-mannosidase